MLGKYNFVHCISPSNKSWKIQTTAHHTIYYLESHCFELTRQTSEWVLVYLCPLDKHIQEDPMLGI